MAHYQHRPTFMVWWASVGLEWHGEKLSWLFPQPLIPAVSFTVLQKSANSSSELLQEILLEGGQIILPDYEPCLDEIISANITELILKISETISDAKILIFADYLNCSFEAFTRWNRESGLSLPIHSARSSPGLSPFYVVYGLKPEEISPEKVFLTPDHWSQTNLGIAFMFASNKDSLLNMILDNQGVYFAADLYSEDDRISPAIHQVSSLMRAALNEYRLPEFAEAMIVPYGGEMRQQMLFLHRRLQRECMLTMIQSIFRLPLIVSYPSLEELKAWDWSLELPSDIKWIEHIITNNGQMNSDIK